MRKVTGIAFLLMVPLTLIVWGVTTVVQEQLPYKTNLLFFYLIGSLVAVAAFLSYMNDIISLAERISKSFTKSETSSKDSPLTRQEEPLQLDVVSKENEEVLSLSHIVETKTLDNINKGVQNCPRLLHTLTGHIYWLLNLSFSSDGKILVSGSSDKTARVWNVQTGKIIEVLGRTPGNYHPQHGGMFSIAISQDGHTIATGDCTFMDKIQFIRLWRFGKEVLKIELPDSGYITNMSFSPDDRFLAASILGTGLVVYDVRTGKEKYCLKTKVRKAVFSFDWGTAAINNSDFDKSIELWDYVEQKKVSDVNIETKELLSNLALGRKKQFLAVSANLDVIIYDFLTQKEFQWLKIFPDLTTCLSFSPTDEILAVGCRNGSVFLYEIQSGRNSLLVENQGKIQCLAFSPDGNLLAVGMDGPRENRAFSSGLIQIWQLK